MKLVGGYKRGALATIFSSLLVASAMNCGGGGNQAKPSAPADTDAGPGDDGINVPNVPPKSCNGGFDVATKTLNLQLDGIKVVSLAVVGGEFQVNSATCSAPDGTKTTTENLQTIKITGTPDKDAVIIDNSNDSFGKQIFSASGGILMDLGDGDDTLVVKATSGDDTIRAGTFEGKLYFDLTNDGIRDGYATGVEAVTFALGRGNDIFRGSGQNGTGAPVSVPLTINAGDGDDVVVGGSGADIISGGAGNDMMSGGDGDDTFEQGDSPDGSDLMNGGDGEDFVNYFGRKADLNVTLCMANAAEGCAVPACTCVANDGEANENDNLVNIENVDAGSGNDTLIGSVMDNTLSGGPGDDTIDGSGGNDHLFGDEGKDTLTGGDGEDYLDGLRDGVQDIFNGGLGQGDICITETGLSETPTACELY